MLVPLLFVPIKWDAYFHSHAFFFFLVNIISLLFWKPNDISLQMNNSTGIWIKENKKR
ncbi:hypothetical protein NC651_001083 [Populus alba x Populus x berolinensis]|nr:hypothetical protein NC651_001083 [Populus alba x Populus x berolinensis]